MTALLDVPVAAVLGQGPKRLRERPELGRGNGNAGHNDPLLPPLGIEGDPRQVTFLMSDASCRQVFRSRNRFGQWYLPALAAPSHFHPGPSLSDVPPTEHYRKCTAPNQPESTGDNRNVRKRAIPRACHILTRVG